MNISQLIQQLQDIQATHGDIEVGSSSPSYDEGNVYPCFDVHFADTIDGNKTKHVDILFDTEGEPLNEFDDEEDEEGDDSFEAEITGVCRSIAACEECGGLH